MPEARQALSVTPKLKLLFKISLVVGFLLFLMITVVWFSIAV
jgi:hypothetical protein